MNHVQHIAQNKQNLENRWKIIRSIREFFWNENFIEVETPLLLHIPGQEPYLDPMKVLFQNERGENYTGYLHTSPEYSLKKMLGAGYTQIFSLCKCFRSVESFGGTHNPEFTMIEWYRTGVDFTALMDDVEKLCFLLGGMFKKEIHFKRMHMKEIWKEILDVNLDELLTDESLKAFCMQKGYSLGAEERYEDMFYRIFLNEIEPKLEEMGNVILHHYPAQMAALAKLDDADNRYAERFEVYMNGMEIANAFSELTDGKEQRKRFLEEQEIREKLGKERIEIDEEFIYAVDMLPQCTGIALGVDRLVQVLLGCKNIDNVLTLPMSKLIS
ncbi:MAG: EF-P lysine aminoacylase EpmA [Candidatus Magasanikbacteria bacterium]